MRRHMEGNDARRAGDTIGFKPTPVISGRGRHGFDPDQPERGDRMLTLQSSGKT